jgi:hypothetical protein
MSAAVVTEAAGSIPSEPALAVAYPDKMNKTEVHWCAVPSRLRLCKSAYDDLARWAIGHAKKCEADPSTCTNGDEANAYQHCLWSAALKLYHGEKTARGFLQRHEANSNGDEDSKRDWANNDIGFRVAADAAADIYVDPSLTKKAAILPHCIDLAKAEQLTYIK